MAKFTKAPMLDRTILAAVDRGLGAACAVLGRRLREMLSKPGGGRVYAIGTRKTGKDGKTYRKVSRTVMNRLRKLGITPTRNRFGGLHITQGEAMRVYYADMEQRSAKGQKTRNLRQLGFHRASAPGQPPAVNTGALRNSWQVGAMSPSKTTIGRLRVFRVGSASKYARRLEYGGSDSRGINILPRPYIAPTLRESGGEMVEAFRHAVAGTLAAAATLTTEVK